MSVIVKLDVLTESEFESVWSDPVKGTRSAAARSDITHDLQQFVFTNPSIHNGFSQFGVEKLVWSGLVWSQSIQHLWNEQEHQV